MDNTKQLLDDLSSKANCIYLSELTNNLNILIPIITEIEADTYPVEQWNDAIHYLCKKSFHGSNASQAKEYLLEKITHPGL